MKTPTKLLLFFFLCILLNSCNSCVPPPPGERADLPDISNLVKTMLYYRIDDNSNFQTLQFQISDSLSYTNIGRFSGKALQKGRYRLDSLETKMFRLDSIEFKQADRYKISKISILEKSTENHIFFELQITYKDSLSNSKGVDYTYGKNPNEKPFELNKGAKMSFETDFSQIANMADFVGGGYECNGETITLN